MTISKTNIAGFSIVEMMIAIAIGIIISYCILVLYIAQTQNYKTANSQALIQSTENAIINMVTPIIRGAGFTGCSSIMSAVSNLNEGGPDPIGSINTVPTLIKGYSGGTSAITLQENPTNSNNTNDWAPALDPSLSGSVIAKSDVLVVLGSIPNNPPIAITSINDGSNTFILQGTGDASLANLPYAAVSDCGKTIVFAITNANGATISHALGTGTLQNASASFPVSFQPGAQFIALQQTAFFVGQRPGGGSALMRAILEGTNWNIQPIVPGIELMKVQYGIGDNGIITQYVTANSISDWSRVYSIRIAFVIAGLPGSGMASSPVTVLETSVTPPSDTRLRHVFEMTIHLRNSLS